MKKVTILWTGGFDSTFRISQLSREEVEIHPIYVIDKQRTTYKKEIDAINKMLDLIKKKDETKAKFCDITMIEMQNIPKNDAITEAYSSLKCKYDIGSQYEWLSRLSTQYPGLELGVEKHIKNNTGLLAKMSDEMVLTIKDRIGKLDENKSTKNATTVFGRFSFPIVDYYEREMLELIKEWKYEDIFQNIWFCHSPINGKPCGMCNPCQIKLKDEMYELFTNRAIKNYKRYNKIGQVFGKKASLMYKKIARLR